MCRYREDGTFEYVGRVDEQVKVRGVRIELGEIEAVLVKAKGIAEAVVVVREQAGEKRLILVVEDKGRELSVSEMRKYLAGTVPGLHDPRNFRATGRDAHNAANGKSR